MNFEEIYEEYKHLVPITIERTYGDINYLADKYKIEPQDIIQMGNIGLWNAYKNYNKNKSKFQSYAINQIKWTISVELKRILQEVYLKDNSIKMNEENIVEVDSFNKNINKNDETYTYEDIMKNEDILCDVEGIAIVNKMIDSLSNETDKTVAQLLFEGHKAIDIAPILGVNRKRISQRIQRIRKELKEHGVVI